MSVRRSAIFLVALSLVAAGCGGGDDKKSSVSPSDRVAGCLDKQPEATQSDCEGWEEEGQLDDDGTHQGHESMG